MKLIRLLALMLAVLLLATFCTSCALFPDPDAKSGENEEEDPDAVKEEKVLQIVTTGVTSYVIVRDYKAGNSVIEACNRIVDAILKYTGATITIKECFNDREDETDIPEAKEILVGRTNRPESEQALKGLRSNDWVMGIYGSERLVLGSPSDNGTMTVATEFLNQFVYEQGNKYEVKNGNMQSLTFSESQNRGATATYSYSLFQMQEARIDSYLLVYPKEVTAANTADADVCKSFATDLRTYISKEAGYELEMRKDTRAYGDYEILVGDTTRTDESLAERLGPDDYLIKLIKNGEGAQLIILFGTNARDAAMTAFKKEVLKPQKEEQELSYSVGTKAIWTNNDALKN